MAGEQATGVIYRVTRIVEVTNVYYLIQIQEFHLEHTNAGVGSIV